VNRSKGGVPDDIPEVILTLPDASGLGIGAALKQAGLVPSTSEAVRMLEQGGVRVNGETISDRGLKLREGQFVLQVGKRKFAKVTLLGCGM